MKDAEARIDIASLKRSYEFYNKQLGALTCRVDNLLDYLKVEEVFCPPTYKIVKKKPRKES